MFWVAAAVRYWPPPLAAGKHMIAIDTAIKGPGQAGTVTLTVDGKQVGKANLKRTVPATFTAT
jgi:arylsulfatase